MRSLTGSLMIFRRPPSNTLKLVPAFGAAAEGRIEATSNCWGDWSRRIAIRGLASIKRDYFRAGRLLHWGPDPMSRPTLSFLFLASAVVFAVLAAATVIPFPSSMMSDLGYYTLCPFAPWSTLMLLFVAGISWV